MCAYQTNEEAVILTALLRKHAINSKLIQSMDGFLFWNMAEIYETALRHRVYFTRGDNRRIPGWMQLHYRMSFDEQGYPMLYVLSLIHI